MKHLFVFDMDETLLSPDKTISPANRAALEHLRQLDIGFTIATGRSPFMVGRYIDELAIPLPVIACNGGIISGTDLRTVIWENPIRKDLQKHVLTYLAEADADVVAYTADMVFYSENSVRVEAFRKYNKTVPAHRQAPLSPFTPDVIREDKEDFIKILLFYPTPEQEAYLRSVEGLEVLSSGENFLDIMQEGSTKGNAVKALASYLGLPIENVAVFGDNENDISMFRSGALSVAMGNSRDFVKAEARYVTSPNTESGVARAIEEFVLPEFGY